MRVSRIRKCHDLTAVSRLVGKDSRFAPAMAGLRSTKTHEQHLLLAAPATAALSIDALGVTWPERRPLRILVLDAQRYDLFDRGQWWRFIPAMLEQSGDVSVTVCNASSTALPRSRVPHLVGDAHRIRVCLERKRVGAMLRHQQIHQPLDYDLAVAFKPIAPGPLLFADLCALGAQKIPFVFTSFSSTHALFNHALLRAYDACAEALVANNPFALVAKRTGENWNRVISAVRADELPSQNSDIDNDYLEALKITATMVLNSHQLGDPNQSWGVGAAIDGDWIHTMDGVAVSPETGDVLDACTMQTIGRLSPQWLQQVASYEPTWSETDRLVWASHIRYLVLSDGIVASAHSRAVA